MDTVTKGATTISENGLAIIRTFEGLVLHPYLDVVKVATIGYGSTHTESGKAVTMQDAPITKERAEQLLKFEAQAKAYVLAQSLQKDHISLTQNQMDSLCSFAYNTGIWGLLSSTLYKKIKVNPNDPSIKDEFMKWVHGHKPDGTVITIYALVKRRKLECQLYFS